MPQTTQPAPAADPIWVARSRTSAYTWEGRLEAYWECNYDPISDDWVPDEISPTDMLQIWIHTVTTVYPDGLIPIFWYVRSPDKHIFEFMPFRYEHPGCEAPHTFLTYFQWPIQKDTGAKLNWLTLPVCDKRWITNQGDKGGFIQEATGWKPGILQPYLYVPSLLQS